MVGILLEFQLIQRGNVLLGILVVEGQQIGNGIVPVLEKAASPQGRGSKAVSYGRCWFESSSMDTSSVPGWKSS